jgi:putative spermidine/putrescine transport system permease protein
LSSRERHAALNQLLGLPLVVPGVVLGTSIHVFHIEIEIATGLSVLGSIGGLIAGTP